MTGYRECGKTADKRGIEALIAQTWIATLGKIIKVWKSEDF